MDLARKFEHALLVVALAGIAPLNSASIAAAVSADVPHSVAYKAFELYVQLTEERVAKELAPGGSFLHVDTLNPEERETAYGELRAGEVRIDPLTTLDHTQKIACPGCMIQHWVGIIFIPGVTLNRTLALMQNYDHQSQFYAPDVMSSKIISHSGDDFQVFMRFHRTMVITVVLDTEHRIHYQHIDATHAASRAVSTRVQEVEHVGKSNERDLPEDKDNGYLWRINNYWRFLQRDGGTYVQCESVSLSRDIPTGFAWLVTPFAESVPRESLKFTLDATRKQLLETQGSTSNR